MALRLQQALVNSPLTNLKTESVRAYIHGLCSKLGLALNDDLSQQFFALLSAVFEASLGFWICDYVAIVCADKEYSSSDPEEFQLLQPQAVLSWATGCAHLLHKRVLDLFQSGAAPDHIIDLGHATKTLLSVAQAVQATLGSNSHSAQELVSTLQLLHQVTQVLQWLEQQQQQRPGMAPLLISSSASLNRLGSRLAGPQPCPRLSSLAEWQAQLAGMRQAAPNGRLFLDDLIDQLLIVSDGQRQVTYPFPDVLAAVESLFMSGSSSRTAWESKLAVLLYYLFDGGWINSAAPFSQGFQLPLTHAQQWQCHYLMDCAAAQLQQQAEDNSSSSSTGPLDEACSLLGAVACPATPFRFVEALLAAGRPATALAVQRARHATNSSSSSVPTRLAESQVLLRVQLGCGLLVEAFSELRRHCSQLPQSLRSRHVTALMHQLATWAVEQPKQQQPQQQQQQQDGLSRIQQLLQLPLNADEEAALFSWCRQRMAARQSGGYMLPLYLLQRGRSLEALAAYTSYCSSPAGTAAAAAATNDGTADAAAALLHRQLQTLMSAAAAALPPAVRAIATADGSGTSTTPVVAGLGSDATAQTQSMPSVVLEQRGLEPPVFLSPLVAATAAIQEPTAAADAAASLNVEGLHIGGSSAVNPGALFAAELTSSAAAAADTAATGANSSRYLGSLFGPEVLAEAGPGNVALNKPKGSEGAGAGGTDLVPLLFGTPARVPLGPAAAAASTPPGFGGSEAAFATPMFTMSEAEFSRDVLGAHRAGAAAAAAIMTPLATPVQQTYGGEPSATRRSSKRQKQTPERFRPGGR